MERPLNQGGAPGGAPEGRLTSTASPQSPNLALKGRNAVVESPNLVLKRRNAVVESPRKVRSKVTQRPTPQVRSKVSVTPTLRTRARHSNRSPPTTGKGSSPHPKTTIKLSLASTMDIPRPPLTQPRLREPTRPSKYVTTKAPAYVS